MVQLIAPAMWRLVPLSGAALIGFALHATMGCSSDDADNAGSQSNAVGGNSNAGSGGSGTVSAASGGTGGTATSGGTGGTMGEGGALVDDTSSGGSSSGGNTSTGESTSMGGSAAGGNGGNGGAGGSAGAGAGELPMPCDGDGEPNETPSSACSISLGTEIISRLTTSASDAVDCFAFPVEAGVTYSLVMEQASGPSANYSTADNLFYEVMTESGIVLLDSSNIGGNVALYHEMAVDMSELATLCVTAGSATTQYDYVFRVDEDWHHDLEQDAATFEPNNTVSTAAPLTLGEDVNSRIAAQQVDYVDCFRFDVEADVTYSLVMQQVSGPGADYSAANNLFYEVMTESGIILVELSNIGGNLANYHELAVDTSGGATLCIEGGAQNVQYDYALRLDEDWEHDLVQDDATYEPNNTVATSYPVTLGMDWSSRFTTSQADYADCYRFDVVAGVSYTLTVEQVDGPGANYSAADNLFYSVVSESGLQLLPQDNIGGNAANTHELAVDTTELATLCLQAGSASTQYDYTFRIDG